MANALAPARQSDNQDPQAGGTCQLNTLNHMKINSILGKMKGKVGNIVLTSVGGEVVGREYNPNVANPNTAAQQNTRSKFKLASQLSAAMAPVIAIKKEGNVSARNLFVKENFGAIAYSNGAASINLNVVQLTKSQRSFSGFSADRSSGSAIAVELNEDSAAALSRVVYIAYKKLADGSLVLFDSKVCSTAGDEGKFNDVLNYTADAVVLYAYGMKDLEAGITSKFGNLNAPTAENVAQLLVSNSENMASVQLTKTAGMTMAAGVTSTDSDDASTENTPAEPVAAPTISGTTPFDGSTTVTISAASGASVYYTTDGSNPSSASTPYSSALTISTTTTVKAIAIKGGVSSEVATKTFVKNEGGGNLGQN